ncbi:3-phytase [Halovibrio salipaludis]|uniref:3-phytase n=1 Tax=Halovibrio salipaludis TaxID=2032626 RepID=A0A2A2F2M1_9GAMM|nr:phytase [Halovibrio salipaludis]PAU79696.1 3-phytase [Halovibrio salipaludis]
MSKGLYARSALVLSVLAVTGCTSPADGDDATADALAHQQLAVENEDTLALAGEWALAVEGDQGGSVLLSVGENSGARLQTADGNTLAHWDRPLEYLDTLPDGSLFASYDSSARKPVLYGLDTEAGEIELLLEGGATDYGVEDVCLYRDHDEALYLFMLGEDYRAHQMLVTGSDGQYALRPVRELPTPPGGEYCAVDQASGTLYVSEEDATVYAYDASPETSLSRSTVDLANPWGNLGSGPRDLVSDRVELFILERGEPSVHSIRREASGHRYQGRRALAGDAAPETVTLGYANGERHLLVFDEEAGRYTRLQLPAAEAPERPERLPEVRASMQTEVVPSPGDAADDPAVWVHPGEPAQSLILGTNKRAGLHVYDLDGRERQFIGNGRVNNVDVRYGASFNGQEVDVAAATNRTTGTISLYAIERDTRELALVSEVPTDLNEIYGFCLYQPEGGPLYGFANDKDGTFDQFRLSVDGDEWSGERVRRFSVPSQPEGCVADDQWERLFVGEEAEGIHVIGANPDDGTDTEMVAPIDNEVLFADVEGLNIYRGDKRDYLVASAQDNNSFAVYEATPPFKPLGAFRIGMNPGAGIDGASETDGLFATSANLGPDFPEGMLVVQDGRKVMPQGNQNFKAVPWERIRELLLLE